MTAPPMANDARTIFLAFVLGVALALISGVVYLYHSTPAAKIKIATAGPMTGQYAHFGTQLKAGAYKAISDINAAGGVLGKQLMLFIGDDACDPRQAVAVAGELAAAEVIFVAGHFCSGSSIPAANVYAEENIIQISPASTNPRLTDERAGPNVFRVSRRDDQQGNAAGEYIAKEYAGKNIAILHDNSVYGKGLADETRKFMNAAGQKEAMYAAYTAGKKDYTALVSKMKKAGIDAAYVGGSYTEAGLIVRQMREQGMQTQLISGDALVTQKYWQMTGKAGEGSLMTFSPEPRKNPHAQKIIREFRSRKIEPEGYVLYTYAAIQAWAQAVEAAQSTEPNKVIQKLNQMEFSTVLGKFKFNKKGDPNLPPYILYEWNDGQYRRRPTSDTDR